MRRFLLCRPLSLLVCSALGYSSAAHGINVAVANLTAAVVAQLPTDDYTDTPSSVDEGVNPQVQPVAQGGLWSSENLASFNDSYLVEADLLTAPTPPLDSETPGDTGDNQSLVGRPEPLPRSQAITTSEEGVSNIGTGPTTTGGTTGTTTTGSTTGTGGTPTPTPPSTGPETPLPPGGNYGPTSGEGNNWEGTGPGGGSSLAPGTVNTQTGNRLTTMPITGWKSKGGLDFGLTLYHNAQDNVDVGWGRNWRSNLDFRIAYTGNVNSGVRDYLTVIYPTGKRLTFTRVKDTMQSSMWRGRFFPPKGYYDVVFLTNNDFSLRTKDQMVYRFDLTGYLKSKSDRFGNTITITRSANKVVKATDPSGRSLSFTYSNFSIGTLGGGMMYANGVSLIRNDQSQQIWGVLQAGAGNGLKYLTRITPPPVGGYAYHHSFAYTASGAISTEVDTMGRAYAFTYDNNLRLKTFKDPLLNTYTYTYNASNTVLTKPDAKQTVDYYDGGVLRSVQDEAGFSQTFTYDADFNITQLKDERGNLQRFTYDAFGNCTSSQDPLQFAANKATSTSYNSFNDVMSQTDTRGASTTLSRNASTGTVQSASDPLGNVLVNNTYETTGALASSSAAGATTSATYDSYGRLKTVTGPDSSSTLSYGDILNLAQPTQSVDNRGRTTILAYDEWGRVTSANRSDGATMSIFYDPMSRVTKVVDWLGHQTLFTYDIAGRRTVKQNARGDIEQYGYDSCNRVTSITDGRNKTKSYLYSARGEVTRLTMADGTVERYKYDAGGNQTARTNALSQTTEYDYDAADNLWKVRYPTGTPTVFTYDLDGRQTVMTDATGTTTFAYDLAGRQTGLNQPQGNLSYAYDQWGRRTVVTHAANDTTQTNYANEKVVSVVKLPENETTQWTYDVYGRISTQVLPNGAVTSYGYDGLDRVNSIVHRKSDNTVISAETYQYDAGGNLTYKIVDGVRTDYAYDVIDQLTSEVRPGVSIAYTYDGNGNRLTKTVNGQVETYAYDDGDKLLSRSGGSSGTFTYAYDACGRTTSVSSGFGITTLGYDYEDRLTAISGPAGSSSYTYNGADTRVAKAGSGGNRTYKHDGVSVTAPVLSDGASTMVPGISERTNGVSRFSHLDRLGTNAKTTNGSQSVVDAKTYDAFGMGISILNPSGSEKGFASAFGYQEDSESGLKLLGHRYYDPAIGRFITPDKAGIGRNWYKYADNNPLKKIDSNGLCPACVEELALEAGEMAAEEAAAAGEPTLADFVRFLGMRAAQEIMAMPAPVRMAIFTIMALVEQAGQEAAFGPAGGTLAHSAVEAGIKGTQFAKGVNVGAEVSYGAGGVPNYWGQKGSVRCDAVIDFGGRIWAVLDYKFGKARLSLSRVRKIINHLPAQDEAIPVLKIPGRLPR